MELLSQHPLFSTDIETNGFDILAGKKWIYPENYPVRKYQFNIVKTALFHNTLVGLPTGLGKTFIAAVVMYNFWRWYPQGIIVFLAPTKPLVAQQIDACHDIMGIPISETIELTGNISQQNRQHAWTTKRVIFATPQTFQNDLEKNIVPIHLIKCVVLDEAHKATGKYAYCESIRMLFEVNKYIRVLALSATPGSRVSIVQEVIKNLHITQLELRNDVSPDITPYINKKIFDIIQVNFGDVLTRFHERYVAIMDPYYRVLVQNHVINSSITNISKGKMYLICQDYQHRQKRPWNNSTIQKYLSIVYTMVYAKELLTHYGLRAFYNFFQNHSDKYWLKDAPELEKLLQDISIYMGEIPDVTSLVDGTITEVPDNITFGHQKFYKLKEVISSHFQTAAEKNIDTRAIVFVEYRDSVKEIFVLLHKFQPLIRPQIFVGQAKAGLKQKDQKEALHNFRQNKVNVLISTAVGEEGLDVGEVDLIVCFDNAKQSTTRMVQRIGRTGRKRTGRIIALVTEGKEYHELMTARSKSDSLNSKLLQSSAVTTALQNESARMVPEDLNPECLKMHMTIIPKSPRAVFNKKKAYKNQGEKRKYTKRTASESENRIFKSAGVEPSIKNPKQSSLMNFFQSKPTNHQLSSTSIDHQDDEVVSMRVEEVHRCSHNFFNNKKMNFPRIKPTDAKLLSSDNEAIEFLTLYTMKESTKDLQKKKNLINIPYIPNFNDNEILDNADPLADYEIPSLDILNCIKSLREYAPTVKEDKVNYKPDEWAPINDWEPSDFPDDSNFIDISNFHDDFNSSASPDTSLLPKGHFEDLLDNSDSDETMYCPDETLPSQERINLTMENENSLLCKAKNIINGCIIEESINNQSNRTDAFNEDNKCDELHELNRQDSLVENGAFEDLLNTSSDDSIEIIGNNLLNCKLNNLVNSSVGKSRLHDSNENRNNNKTEIENKDANKIEEMNSIIVINDSPIDVELENFSSWEETNINTNKAPNEIGISSPDIVKTQHRADFSLCQFDKSLESHQIPQMSETPINETITNSLVNNKDKKEINSHSKSINSPINIKENKKITKSQSKSPDLVRHGDSQKSVRARLNMSLHNSRDKFDDDKKLSSKTPEKKSEKDIVSDDDMFGIECLLADSDFEDEMVEKNTKACEEVCAEKNNVQIIKNNEKVCKEENTKNNTVKNSCSSERPKICDNHDNVNETCVDDCNWDSDFELLPEPIVVSKYFSKSSNSNTSSNSLNFFRINRSDNNSRENDLLRSSQKENHSTWITVKSNPKLSEKSTSKAVYNVRKSSLNSLYSLNFNQPKSVHHDSNSDEDFAPSKIEKVYEKSFKNNNIASKKDNRIKETKSGLQKPLSASDTRKCNGQTDSSTCLSINLSKFAAPKKIASDTLNTSGRRSMSESWIETRRRSPDNNSKKNDEQIKQTTREKKKTVKSKNRKNDFIDDEANVSADDDHRLGSSDDEGDHDHDDDDSDLDGFVSYTQHHDNTIDMRAHYLQSIRSPRRPGKFLIKQQKNPRPAIECYSQAVPEEENTYIHDSFCVGEDEEDILEESLSDEITILQVDEKELTKNKRKRMNSYSQESSRSKRKRIIQHDDTSDEEDETEQMRAQIAEESMILKNL